MIKYGSQDPLYVAIMKGDEEAVRRLKACGRILSDEVKYALTHCTGTLVKPGEGFNIAIDFEGNIQRALMDGMLGYFVSTVRAMRREVGEPLYLSNSVFWGCTKNFYDHAVFECILDCFDNRRINKKQNMIYAIDNDRLDLLEIAIAHDWLKMPRKRDEMITYAENAGKTEIIEYLLDFKNRTADLAAERIKAEKKMLAELNADPNSVSELKKIWSFEKRENGTLIITSYKGKRAEVEVPAVIGKNTVTAIGDQAFSSGVSRIRDEQRDFRKTELVKITLPDTVRSIGEGAFSGCWNLCEVNIPDGVVEIGRLAFGGCRKVMELKLPDSLKKIGDGAFAGCWNLCEVNIPDGVVEIGRRAFNECRKIAELKLPDSVRSIGEGAFADCETITGIRVPEGVTEIGDYTFSGCGSLKSVSLPGTVMNIGKLAFHGCSSLEKIVIPEGVAEIGSLVFERCGALKTVVLPASLKKIKNYKYRDQPPVHILQEQENVTVIVEPKSYAEKYCKRNNINYKYK